MDEQVQKKKSEERREETVDVEEAETLEDQQRSVERTYKKMK